MTRLAAALRDQGTHCAALGSPFMERLCALLADRLRPGTPLMDRLFDWQGDLGPGGDSVPLRLCGALHALRLQNRAGLAEVYPPHAPTPDALWDVVAAALVSEAAFVDDWINSPPQTNEVRRSSALIAVGHLLTQRYGLPLVLSEIGASGGLNMVWDRYALTASGHALGARTPVLTLSPDWDGPVPAPAAHPKVAERRGVDLNPLNPKDPLDQLRLTAYLWADQPDRLALTKAALGAAEGIIDRADAVDWLRDRAEPKPGHVHLIYSTVAWQYLPAAARAEGQAVIEAAAAHATATAPIAWFGMENDGAPPGAALTLRLWPGDIHLTLGRADFHGRWVHWSA